MLEFGENMIPEEYGPSHNLSPSEKLIARRLDEFRKDRNDETLQDFPIICLMASSLGYIPYPEEYASELDIEAIRYQATILAEEDAKQFHLQGEDPIALEQLYQGFTQITGLQTKGDVFYCAHITRGAERTHETRFSFGRKNKALFGEDTQRRLYTDRVWASKPLYDAIMSRFNVVSVLEGGLNIRFSNTPVLYGTQLRYTYPNTILARPLAI